MSAGDTVSHADGRIGTVARVVAGEPPVALVQWAGSWKLRRWGFYLTPTLELVTGGAS